MPANKPSRTAFARILKIDQLLAEPGAFLNADELSTELEMSRRTILRDIEFMTNQLGCLIETERRDDKHGYFYTEEGREKRKANPLGFLAHTQQRLLSLLFAQKAVSQFNGTPFEEPLKESLNRFAEDLGTDRSELHTAMQAVSFRQFAWEDLAEEDFEILHRAIRCHRTLRFTYRRPGGTGPGAREIEPLHLTHCWNRWYLVGFDLDRQACRTFAVKRMGDIEVTRTEVKHRGDFDIDAYLRGSFGIVAGSRFRKVVIDFDASAADLIRERVWHPSQTLKDLDDGGVRLTLRLSSLDEIADWILGWGARAVARQPRELVQKLGDITATMSKRYDIEH